MAKRKSGKFKNPPKGLAAFVGRTLGKLAAKRDRLARQLAGVEREIEGVHETVRKLEFPKTGTAPAARGKRQISEATRKKMADAAKARWAAARKAGKQRQG